MTDKTTVEQRLELELGDIKAIVETLDAVSATIRDTGRFDGGTITFALFAEETERLVTATYTDGRWLVLL